MYTAGHMTLSQCTLLVTWPITSQHFSSILWSCDLVGECMTFWDKCEQAGYVEFACKRLTLVAMVPCNWLGHSCLITHVEVCSFIFIIVLLRGGLRTTVASSPGPSLPPPLPLPKGGLGDKAKNYRCYAVCKALTVGWYHLCVLWPHCRTLLDLLWTDCWCHTWLKQWGCWREVREYTSHDIICSAVMDGINAAELTWRAGILVHVVGSCTL